MSLREISERSVAVSPPLLYYCLLPNRRCRRSPPEHDWVLTTSVGLLGQEAWARYITRSIPAWDAMWR
jgi:hypothetical protein